MERIISYQFKINRPFIFLCGPYYDKRNSADRREILRQYINSLIIDDINPFAIIVDLITQNNTNCDIQLLEEIVSSISLCTIILLDTISTGVELGLFSHKSNSYNHILVAIPEKTNLIKKDLIGNFVLENIIGNSKSNVMQLDYCAKVTPYVYASNYTIEHYYFANQNLPPSIQQEIDRIIIDQINKSPYSLIFDNNDDYSFDINKINYFTNSLRTNVYCSLSLVFYLVSTLMLEKYQNLVSDNIDNDIEDESRRLYSEIEGILVNSLNHYLNPSRSYNKNLISIRTHMRVEMNQIIKSILVFLRTYVEKYKKVKWIIGTKRISELLTNQRQTMNYVTVFDLLDISSMDEDVLQKAAMNPETYYEDFTIYSNKKQRKIVQYSSNIEGQMLKKIHRTIYHNLCSKYIISNDSFAYKKTSNTYKCVSIHLKSSSFIKMDITKFFNSINRKILFEKLLNVLYPNSLISNLSRKSLEQIELLLDTFFYKDSLPLGLICSPILSDIYLNNFDELISSYTKSIGLKYSRYADDLIFSTVDALDSKNLNVISIVKSELNKIKLNVNEQKTKTVSLLNSGDHVKLLGLNIVKGEKGNKVNIGKKYMKQFVNDYIHSLRINLKKGSYEYTNILGRFNYIVGIDTNNIKYLRKLLFIRSHGRLSNIKIK